MASGRWDHISFLVGQGEIVGLLGPNGAGKTTTINMVLGILKSTEGTIEVMGKNLNKRRSDIGRYVNFAAVYAQVPANLTVRQNLFVFALLYGVRKPKQKLAALMREFDLERFADKKAGLLSSGEMSRLNLAKAVMNSPRLLLLDEPTASLDPSISLLVREKIKASVRVPQCGNTLDLPQYERDRGGLRSGAFSVSRPDTSGGRSAQARSRARQERP